MAIDLIAKIAPKNDGFTGMVDADQVLGGGDSGTLPDAAVAETNVTQHEGAIDHDQLTNFAANEHFTEASISHANIQNIGSNTHAQIDTAVSNSVSHIANTSNPHSVTAAQLSALPLSGGTMSGNLNLGGNMIKTFSATSLTSDTATSFAVSGTFMFFIGATTAANYMWGRFNASTGNGSVFISNDFTLINDTVLTGTTGASGTMSISVSSSTGLMYIENRESAGRPFSMLCMN